MQIRSAFVKELYNALYVDFRFFEITFKSKENIQNDTNAEKHQRGISQVSVSPQSRFGLTKTLS